MTNFFRKGMDEKFDVDDLTAVASTPKAEESLQFADALDCTGTYGSECKRPWTWVAP